MTSASNKYMLSSNNVRVKGFIFAEFLMIIGILSLLVAIGFGLYRDFVVNEVAQPITAPPPPGLYPPTGHGFVVPKENDPLYRGLLQ